MSATVQQWLRSTQTSAICVDWDDAVQLVKDQAPDAVSSLKRASYGYVAGFDTSVDSWMEITSVQATCSTGSCHSGSDCTATSCPGLVVRADNLCKYA